MIKLDIMGDKAHRMLIGTPIPDLYSNAYSTPDDNNNNNSFNKKYLI